MKYLALAALALLPTLSFAATYHYVNTSGEVAAVEAPNAQAALTLPDDIAQNSGVALDLGYLEAGTEVNGFGYSNNGAQAGVYHYVNAQGYTDTVTAPDANTALVIAPDIASNSGVAVDQGLIEDGEYVQSAE